MTHLRENASHIRFSLADEALVKMRAASDAFYSAAVRTGCHAFIEFAGLINEYIDICSAMTASGNTDWMHASARSGTVLPMKSYQIRYLAEKLDCIYGPTLRASKDLQRVIAREDSRELA